MYKYSTVNRYGFRHRFATCVFLLFPIIMCLSLFVPPVIAPALYPLYTSFFHVGEGDVGAPSTADTPVASSIAEMKEMETFTTQCLDPYWDETDGPAILDNVRYYILDLPSGEKICARVRMKAVAKSENEDVPDVLPIGTLRSISPKEIRGNGEEAQLTTTEYYVDMVGDFGLMLSEESFEDDIGRKMLLLYLPLLVLVRIIGVHLGLFSPFFFARRDPFLPKNDLELWATSVNAILSTWSPMQEGWLFVGGTHRGPIRVRVTRFALKGNWNVTSKKSGLERIQQYVEAHGMEDPSPEAAFDLENAFQLAANLYQSRMISREEMDREYSRIGKKMQSIFSSWEQLCENYLEAYAQWQLHSAKPKEAEKNIKSRYHIYQMLKEQDPGPYTSVPWNLDLSWHPTEQGDRTITQKILKTYYKRD